MTLPPHAEPSARARAVALLLGVPYLIGILVLTLAPQPVEKRMPAVLDLVLGFAHRILGWDWLGFSRLELIANVLVFAPIGILAYLAFRDRLIGLALIAGPLLSVLVETTQALMLPHRVPSVVDVLANSTGATAGVVLAWLVSRAIHASATGPSTLETP